MEIEKSKIQEIRNGSQNNAVLYSQQIKNIKLNEVKNITAENINSLLSKVRKQMEEWDQ